MKICCPKESTVYILVIVTQVIDPKPVGYFSWYIHIHCK